MNLLLLDQDQAFVGFALRCMRAGHHVKVCMAKNPKTHNRTKIGDGLVEKIEGEEWAKHMNWADLVVTSDNNKWLKELDVYKKKGYPVFSPSYESAQLELDRGKGQALFVEAGIPTVPYEVFSDFKKAEDYALKKGERLVSKPYGDKADKSLSHVSKSAKDMVYMLRKWKGEANGGMSKFMLQDYVEGIEFGVAGWLGPKGFLPWFEEHFEYKKLMADDYGPNTGEMGTPCHYVKDSMLAKELLLPLERDLIRLGHTGSVAVGAMIDEEGTAYPLEFTMRLGWPAFDIVQPLHPECCQWMADLLDGQDTFHPTDEVAVGFVIAMPPFPSDHMSEHELCGVPLYGLDEDNPYFDSIFPCQVMSGSAPDDEGKDKRVIVSCGNYLAVAVGTGETVREAREAGLKAVKSVEIPNNPIVRTDIGDGLKQELPKLQEHGFATEWSF